MQTILDLLNADEDSHSVFQEQVMDLVHQEISQSYINTKIGIYRIKEELGSGGMGMVYLAEREQGDFQQKVAIKILKRGMDSVAISRRFQNDTLYSGVDPEPGLNTLPSQDCMMAVSLRTACLSLPWNMSRAFLSIPIAISISFP